MPQLIQLVEGSERGDCPAYDVGGPIWDSLRGILTRHSGEKACLRATWLQQACRRCALQAVFQYPYRRQNVRLSLIDLIRNTPARRARMSTTPVPYDRSQQLFNRRQTVDASAEFSGSGVRQSRLTASMTRRECSKLAQTVHREVAKRSTHVRCQKSRFWIMCVVVGR